MKNSVDVFDFKEEDELAEFAAGKLLEKFKNPNPDDSPILKYQFLQNFSQGNDTQKEERENVHCVDVDADAVDSDYSCDDAPSFPNEAENSSLNPACQLNLKRHEHKTDAERVNYGSRSFSDKQGSFKEIPASKQSPLNCSLSVSPSSPEQVDMMSANDGSLHDCSTSSLDSNLAEDGDLLKGCVANCCFDHVGMDDINTAVIISPDYAVLRDKYCTAALVIFSCNGVKLKGSTTEDIEGSFYYEWRVEEIVNIEYEWFQKIGLVILKLHVLLKDERKSENIQGTSDIEELKIAVMEHNWPETQRKINLLNVKYPAVWNAVVDGNTKEIGEFSQQRHYFAIFDEPFEDVIYPKGDPDAVSICKRDVELLKPETFINDTIIDFYIKYLKNQILPEEKNRFYFFNSFFFRKLVDLDKDPSSITDGKAAFQRVRKWTRKVDIFGKDYILIPVNFNLHWSLIVICHPGELAGFRDENLGESLKVPCILHMDSIRGSHAGLKNLVQSYLCEEWKARHSETSEDIPSKFLNLRFVSLELPQQENSFDCGLFLLHYLELFLAEAPCHFNPFKVTRASNFLNVDWFPPAEASLKRTLIQNLILELLENRSREVSSEEDQSSECPLKNENDASVEVLSERCIPSTVCHKINHISRSQDGQGIEMTLLERSAMRNLQSVSDSGVVLRELFDPGATAGALLGQFQSFEHPSPLYPLNSAISPREQVDAETGEQFICFTTSESNLHQISEITAPGSSLSLSCRGFRAEASWDLGISVQGEHEVDSTTEMTSASDDSDDVGIIENNPMGDTGLSVNEKAIEHSAVRHIASLSTHPASSPCELPETSSALEDTCHADEKHDSKENEDSLSRKDHSIFPSNQDVVLDEDSPPHDSEMMENKNDNVEEVNVDDDHLSTEAHEQQAAKRRRLTREGEIAHIDSVSKDLQL